MPKQFLGKNCHGPKFTMAGVGIAWWVVEPPRIADPSLGKNNTQPNAAHWTAALSSCSALAGCQSVLLIRSVRGADGWQCSRVKPFH